MNDPRASLLVPFASPWQLRSGTGPNWDQTGTHQVRAGRERTRDSPGVCLIQEFTSLLHLKHPHCLFLWQCCKVHQIVEALKSRGRRAGELASGEGCLILLPTPAYGFK